MSGNLQKVLNLVQPVQLQLTVLADKLTAQKSIVP